MRDGETQPTTHVRGSRLSLDGVVHHGAVGFAVGVTALATATLLRPRAGYTSPQPLLGALSLGAGLGVASLGLVGLVAHIRSLDSLSFAALCRSATAWRSLGVVVFIFVTSAIAPRIVHGVDVLTQNPGASLASKQADFRRWQQVVVPIVVSYTSDLKTDGVFVHGLPLEHPGQLLRALINSQRAVRHLRANLRLDSAQLPSRPELRHLTALLDRSLALGQQAQGRFRQAINYALRTSGSAAALRGRAKKLVALGLRQLGSSQSAMADFSFGANWLGGSLFAQTPAN